MSCLLTPQGQYPKWGCLTPSPRLFCYRMLLVRALLRTAEPFTHMSSPAVRCPLSAFRPHGAEGFCLLYVTTACRWLHTCELPQARVDSSLKPRLSTSRSIAPSTTTWWKFEVEGERFVTSTWLFKIRASGEWAQPPMWAYPAPACPHGPGQAPGGVASRGSGGRGTSLGRPEEPRGAWALTFVFFPSLGFLWSWASH